MARTLSEGAPTLSGMRLTMDGPTAATLITLIISVAFVAVCKMALGLSSKDKDR